jgi:hypothetical protein
MVRMIIQFLAASRGVFFGVVDYSNIAFFSFIPSPLHLFLSLAPLAKAARGCIDRRRGDGGKGVLIFLLVVASGCAETFTYYYKSGLF